MPMYVHSTYAHVYVSIHTFAHSIMPIGSIHAYALLLTSMHIHFHAYAHPFMPMHFHSHLCAHIHRKY